MSALDPQDEFQAYDRLDELAKRRDDLVQFTYNITDKSQQPRLHALFQENRSLDGVLHQAQVVIRSVLLRGGTGPSPEEGNPLFEMSEDEADPVLLGDDASNESRDRELRIARQFASWGQQLIAEDKQATEATEAEDERRMMEEEWEEEKAKRRRAKEGTSR